MAKLQRKSAKLFAENANAGIGGVAQFGSLAAGDPNYSKDVDVIQALDAYRNGWSDAVVGNKSPAIEDRNALDYLLSYQQAYIMQHGIPEWITTETYYKDCYVVDSNGELRVSVIDNNTGHNPIEDEGGQYWGFAGARGSGKRVGEVYFSQSNSATDNPGALPLFTGEVISNADQLYPQFYAWVLEHTTLCRTEAQYQTALSTYGECPYYVINTSAKTIRLPKLVNYIKMANADGGITQSGDAFPEHTHKIASDIYGTPTEWTYLGKGYGGGSNPDYILRGSETTPTLFNTGRAGTGSKVTPAHTTVFPWVCVYNAAIPASTAQAAEFQAALSNKADIDFSNVTAVHIVETTHSGTNYCRKWSDGWCEQGGYVETTNSANAFVTIEFEEPFVDTNYIMLCTSQVSSSPSGNASTNCVKDKTASSIKISRNQEYLMGFFWEAKGYIN